MYVKPNGCRSNSLAHRSFHINRDLDGNLLYFIFRSRWISYIQLHLKISHEMLTDVLEYCVIYRLL